MTAYSDMPPTLDADPSADLLATVERGRVVVAGGWCYVRPSQYGGIYAQHIDNVSPDSDALPIIYRRGVGLTTWSELCGPAVTNPDARAAQSALYRFGEQLTNAGAER